MLRYLANRVISHAGHIGDFVSRIFAGFGQISDYLAFSIHF